MKKLALAILITLASSVGLFAQSSNICYPTVFTATGRKLLAVPGGSGTADRYSAGTYSYILSGSPSGVSITIEGGSVPAATSAPATLITAVTTTTNNVVIKMGQVNQTWKYLYANLGTFSGGTSPTLTVTTCLSPNAVAGGTAGAVPWSGLLAPTGNLSLNFAAKTTTFTNAGLLTYGGDITTSGFLTITGNAELDQTADGDNTLTMIRKTNTTPTGTFINLLGNGSSPVLYKVDIKGNTYTAGFSDFKETSAPANPGAGIDRIYTDSTSHKLACLTPTGTDCMPPGMAIGAAVTSGTAGSVLFVDSMGQLGQDNANLSWSDPNGIGFGNGFFSGPTTGFSSGFGGFFASAYNAITKLNDPNQDDVLVVGGESDSDDSAILEVVNSWTNTIAKTGGASTETDFIHSGAGDITSTIYNYDSDGQNLLGAGNILNFFGFHSDYVQAAGKTTTNYSAFHVATPNATGTVTNAIGLDISDLAVSGVTNAWAIKTGTGKVEFGDTVQIDGGSTHTNGIPCYLANGALGFYIDPADFATGTCHAN